MAKFGPEISNELKIFYKMVFKNSLVDVTEGHKKSNNSLTAMACSNVSGKT